MTNRQWLIEQMQSMSDEELAKAMMNENYIYNIMLENCGIYIKGNADGTSAWLKLEHKEPIKLKDAERVILENIDKDYKWIARNEDDVLYAYIERPVKRDGYWLNTATKYALHLELFSHLFPFIKFENTEPYNIEELLKGE